MTEAGIHNALSPVAGPPAAASLAAATGVSGQSTMADVAAAAGVSLKSVSRVINREPHVSARLRDKVEAAIVRLNYVPDTAARSLAGARSFTIGVLLDNPSPNYTMKILSGVYRACTDHRHHLRIDNIDSSQGDAQTLAQLDQALRHSRADGFVLTPPLTDIGPVVRFLEERGVPFSRIAPVLDPGRTAAALIDDAEAAAAVADRLWALGHRRIGLVTGPAHHGAAATRREGFLRALRAHQPDIVVSEAHGRFAFEAGIAAGHALLGARRHPTAIFATNDDSAAGVMVAAGQLGLKVPDDLSVVGFDDSWIAMSVWPYLTTVRQPIEAMGHAAAMMLLDRSVGRQTPETGAPQQWLAWELIERGSLAMPR